MVRVLHVLPHRGGGGETYIDLLERLPGYRHERLYLSAGRSPLSGLVSIPRGLANLAARARAADILHVHGDVAAVLALPVLGRRRGVMTAQGLHMLRRTTGRRRAVMARALAQVARRAQAVIVSAESELVDLRAVVQPQDAPKLHLIHNGVDPPSQAAAPDTRRALGISPDGVLALFAGQLEPRKAPLLAARAARAVRAAGIPLTLAFAGDGPLRLQLDALAGDGVRVLGHRDDLPALMSAADIFVQAAEREGMSFALLEAMSHGLAIVASDGPGNPEAIADAGLLFPTGDEDALAQRLRAVSEDSTLRRSLGEGARARMLEHFHADRFAQETAAVYEQVLAATAPAPAGAAAGA